MGRAGQVIYVDLFDLLPLSASSGLKAAMEGHANVAFAGAVFALIV